MQRGDAPRSAVPRDLRVVYDQALAEGWAILMGRGGHMIWRPPGGQGQVVVSCSPSDHRERANTLSTLRRYGLAVS